MSDTTKRFQETYKAKGNFGEALAEVFTDLVNLEIITWVARSATDTESLPGNRLRTKINLIDGDIENEIGEAFLPGNQYEHLRDFHESQVSKGADTIKSNLQTLVDICEKVAGLGKEKGKDKDETHDDLSETPAADYGNWNSSSMTSGYSAGSVYGAK
ncbi:MAG: hypothetical protein NW214_01785 [Pseudanabaenaceae cyanobacterium bins.39]|nr:hypothetical protein [Pseudanabaenaceae cyanobacterium bins.39]